MGSQPVSAGPCGIPSFADHPRPARSAELRLMSKVLVATHEFVRRSMAGPAIRAYELARQLFAAGHDVTLAVPVSSDLDDQPFPVVPYDNTQVNGLRHAGVGRDVLVASCGILGHSPILRELVHSV